MNLPSLIRDFRIVSKGKGIRYALHNNVVIEAKASDARIWNRMDAWTENPSKSSKTPKRNHLKPNATIQWTAKLVTVAASSLRSPAPTAPSSSSIDFKVRLKKYTSEK